MCGAGKRAKRHGLVFRIEESVKLRTTSLHAFCKLRLGEALVFHERIELTGDHALDGARRHFFVDALLFQEVVKRRSDAALLFHVRYLRSIQRYAPPCRDTARSKVDVTHLLRLIPARLAAENMALCSDGSARTTNWPENGFSGSSPRALQNAR